MYKSLISTNKNCKLNSKKMGEIDDLTFQTFLFVFVHFCHTNLRNMSEMSLSDQFTGTSL